MGQMNKLICPDRLRCKHSSYCGHSKPHIELPDMLDQHGLSRSPCKVSCDIIGNTNQCCKTVRTKWDK